MDIIFFCSFLTLLLIKPSKGDSFIVSPGDEREFIYSPVDRNAMTSCAVSEEIILEWVIDGQSLESPTQSRALHLRGIFESSREVLSNGVTTSTVTVFGDINVNNSTRLCCRTIVNGDILANCTTVVIYDRPSPPELKIGLTHNGRSEFNLSWTSIATQAGVVQNYTLVFHSYEVKTSENFWIYQPMQPTTKCGTFLAYVKAVNGAGESDPSDNVTIPSLPDIEPVTASLTHQVWKSNGQIMVNVSFESAGACMEYPLKGYYLNITSSLTGESFIISLKSNETGVVLSTQHGVEDNHRYSYTISAFNDVGVAVERSETGPSLITLDVQAVQAAVIDKSTIEVQCLFIPGSDALGCGVVLKSECPSVADHLENISRSDHMPSTKTLISHHNPLCFDQVFAHDIDVDSSVSSLYIMEKVNQSVYTMSGTPTWVAGLVGALVVLVVATVVITGLFICLVGRQKSVCKLSLDQITRSSSFDRTTPPNRNKTEKKAESDVISLDPDAPEVPPPFNPDTEPPPDYGDVCDDERNHNSQPDLNIVNDANTDSRAASVTPNVPVYQEVAENQQESPSTGHDGHVTSSTPNLAMGANDSIPLEELTGPIYHEHTPINNITNIEGSPLFAHSLLSSGPPSYRVSPILGFVDFSRTSPVSSSRSLDLMEHPRMHDPVSLYRYGPPQQHSVTRSFTPRSGRAGVDEWDEFRIPAGGTLV